MNITPEILTALERAINDAGSIYKLAKELNISHSTIFFWRTGKTSKINGKTWNNGLRKKLRPYLSVPAEHTDDEENSSGTVLRVREPRAPYGDKTRSYPLVPYRKLAFFDPNIKSTSVFVQDHASGYFPFMSVAGVTAFALRMDDTLPNEIFTTESTLLIECCRPPLNGEIVLARCKGQKDPRIYRFIQEEEKYRLIPYGCSMYEELQWDDSISSSEILAWIYPVIEANIQYGAN